MNKKYDFVFLTNTPSFYKINLCNQIALTHTLLLVFYGYDTAAVNIRMKDNDDYRFDYIFLHEGVSSERNKFLTFRRLMGLLWRVQYKKIFYSGWFAPEYNWMAFFTSKKKNCVICESSPLESHFTGLKGLVKKAIISRMSTALPSGEPHGEIFKMMGFTGRIVYTGGVGIFNKLPRELSPAAHSGEKKYIYVGRLIDCKNVRFLIEVFNHLQKPLTIVGHGEQSEELQSIAKSNISFLGFVANKELNSIYRAHDVFILPSKSEPWGLVVEEAIYWGLPVIVSNNVGSGCDMVKRLKTGCIFNYNDEADLIRAIKEIELNHETYRNNAMKVDFNERDKKQVEAYTHLVLKP